MHKLTNRENGMMQKCSAKSLLLKLSVLWRSWDPIRRFLGVEIARTGQEMPHVFISRKCYHRRGRHLYQINFQALIKCAPTLVPATKIPAMQFFICFSPSTLKKFRTSRDSSTNTDKNTLTFQHVKSDY